MSYFRQAVDGVVDGVGEPDFVVAGVELHAAARLPLQVLLHLVGQVLGNGLPSPQHQAVQPHAVVKQVPGVVVEAHLQAPVAHDHSVDYVQLPIDLPQVVHGVHMAHRLSHGVGPGLGGKEVQMCVDDLHSRGSFLCWIDYTPERSSLASEGRAAHVYKRWADWRAKEIKLEMTLQRWGCFK